jgi:hypothetical protein
MGMGMGYCWRCLIALKLQQLSSVVVGPKSFSPSVVQGWIASKRRSVGLGGERKYKMISKPCRKNINVSVDIDININNLRKGTLLRGSLHGRKGEVTTIYGNITSLTRPALHRPTACHSSRPFPLSTRRLLSLPQSRRSIVHLVLNHIC